MLWKERKFGGDRERIKKTRTYVFLKLVGCPKSKNPEISVKVREEQIYSG